MRQLELRGLSEQKEACLWEPLHNYHAPHVNTVSVVTRLQKKTQPPHDLILNVEVAKDSNLYS